MTTFFHRTPWFLVAAWLMFSCQPLSAQNTLGLSVRLAKTTLLDQNVSPLPYAGFIPQAMLEWQHHGRAWQSGAALSFGHGTLQAIDNQGRMVQFVEEDLNGQRDTIRVPHVVSWTPMAASFRLLRTLTPLNRDLRMSAGGILAEQLFYSNGFVRPGLMNVVSLSPQLQVDYRPDHGRVFLSAGVTLPLVAVVSRMRYDGTVSEPNGSTFSGFFDNTAFRAPDQYRQWAGFVELGYRFAPRWQLVLGYLFEQRRDVLPRPLDLQSQNLQVSLAWIYHR